MSPEDRGEGRRTDAEAPHSPRAPSGPLPPLSDQGQPDSPDPRRTTRAEHLGRLAARSPQFPQGFALSNVPSGAHPAERP